MRCVVRWATRCFALVSLLLIGDGCCLFFLNYPKIKLNKEMETFVFITQANRFGSVGNLLRSQNRLSMFV
jgi:hypothetical protein